MPIAPGYGEGVITTRSARIGLPCCLSTSTIAWRRDWASSGWSGVHSIVIGPNQPGIRVAMMLNRDAPLGENWLVPGRKSVW